MKLDKKGIEFIANAEGCSLKPYLCSAKKATIGYGNTYYPDGRKVTLLDKEITQTEAVEMLKITLKSYEKAVSNLVTYPIWQNQFNALVSLAYNIGIGALRDSTLLKVVNKGENPSSEFLRWNKINKVESKGLTNRRKKEVEMWNF